MKIHASARLKATVDFGLLEPHIEINHWHNILDRVHLPDGPKYVEASDLWKMISDKGLMEHVTLLFSHMKTVISKLSKELGLEINEIVSAFRTKPMFAFFKAIKFSIKSLLIPIKAFANLYRDGILNVFAKIHQSGAFQKLNSGAIALDDFLEQYPILKRLAGPAIAGLLIWMFLSGNFTFHPDMDMDLAAVLKAALAGKWSIAELFTSAQGLAAIGLLITGILTPWPSPVWLNEAIPFNLLVAMCYTAYKHLPQKGEIKTGLAHIKSHIKFASVK